MWKHWQIFFQCHCADAVSYLSSDVLLQLHLCGKNGSLPLFPLFFSRTDFTSHSLLPRCPHTFDSLSLLYPLLAKQCSHSHADNFFLTSCPWRWWSWSPSLPTLIWGAVTVKWELEVDKNYSLDLNRCNSFRWWEEGLNFAAAEILRHLCFLSKPFFAFEEDPSSQWRQKVIWQLSKACCGQSMLAAQFEYKRFGCKGDRERVIRKGLGHLCYVILLWRKKTYLVTLTRSFTDFAHIYTVCAKMSSMTEDFKL